MPPSPATEPIETNSILPDVYAELRKIARQKVAGEVNQSIGGTTLVHEAFIRMAKKHQQLPLVWESRAHFFGASLEAMRRVIIDRARKKKAQKRGDNPVQVISNSISHYAEPCIDERILAVDDALHELSDSDPECAEIVKLRFFGGLNWDEIAKIMDLSLKTVQRRWIYAKTWLRVKLDL